MKTPSHLSLGLSGLFLLLCTSTFFAQTNQTVLMNGAQVRAPLQVPPGGSRIQLCALVPGNVYTVIALGAAEGQLATFALDMPAAPGAAERLPGRENFLQLTASTACVELELEVATAHAERAIPMFLSVKCETCRQETVWQEQFDQRVSQTILQVIPDGNTPHLVKDILIGGDCLNVSGVNSHYVGPSQQGSFSDGGSNINLSEGIVLATGNVQTLSGPNDEPGEDGGYGSGSYDQDLSNLIGFNNLFDLSAIEFDFVPTESNLHFDFVFGSEEYCEYVGTQFNDAFGFFISGPGIAGVKNIALVPNTTTPVSINTINHTLNQAFYVNNNQYSQPCTFLPVEALNECQLDGWTTVLQAQTPVVPCATYHIKLAIADVGDGVFDSAVFLRANSFGGNGTVNAAPVYANNQPAAYENCGQNFIRFSRGGGDNSQALLVSFTVSPASTATPGVDYVPLSSPVVIPAGQDAVFLPVTVLGDALTEGTENIFLLVDNLCTCSNGTVEFLIHDNAPLTVTVNDTTVCQGSVVTVTASVTGGLAPYEYHWTLGSQDPELTVFVGSLPKTYYVTVSDQCGTTVIDSVLITPAPPVQLTVNVPYCFGDDFVVINGQQYSFPNDIYITVPGIPCDTIIKYHPLIQPQPPTLSKTISFCPGGSVNLGGTTYTQPGTVTLYLPSVWGTCDTVATYTLQWVYPTSNATITFCPGSSVTIDGVTYTAPGTVVDTLAGVNGACDTLVTYTLQVLPQISRDETVTFCPGDNVVIDGTTYSAPGLVSVTIPGANGACDTVVQYNLQVLPYPTASQILSLCPGATVNIGGTSYSAPNTVVDTLQGFGAGCDTLLTYTLELLANPLFFDTLAFCPGDSIGIGGVFYSAFGTVLDTLPGAGGACDTLATYTLQSLVPASSTVQLNCPAAVSLTIPAGNTGETVLFDPASGSTDCLCSGLSVVQSAGLVSGSTFPLGVNEVCYTAEDICGNSAACCFTITIAEAEPCDVKVIGCMKWELLDITQNPELQRTYRIRVTNNCALKMAFTNIQLPNGVVAEAPADGSIYTAPSGRTYEVRNPNLSLFYSIRFNTISDSIADGQSDIFEYTLPPQSQPAYIHVASRLANRLLYEAHLNTFHCPVGLTPQNRGELAADILRIAPNPTEGTLFADLSAWQGENLQLRVFDGRSLLVLGTTVRAGSEPQPVALPERLAAGIYFLEITPQQGGKHTARFVIQH